MPTIITQQTFGTLPNGSEIPLYMLRSETLEVGIIGYGARLRSLRAPDRNGKLADVITGFTTIEGYLADTTYAGATVGRFAGRIANGRFSLDGEEYQLPLNDGTSTLHGGPEGFHAKAWSTRVVEDGVECVYVSADGEMGFPGKLTVRVTYTLEGNALRIHYLAETDKPTVVNLTNHSYFNLCGEGGETILEHSLTLHAGKYLAAPGEIAPVDGTPLDFRSAHMLGERIEEKHPQLELGGGYDHLYVLDSHAGAREVARLHEPTSGRRMIVVTDAKAVVFYSGNFLDGSHVGKAGKPYGFRSALCLETWDLPDMSRSSGVRLDPGEQYERTTVYSFSVE